MQVLIQWVWRGAGRAETVSLARSSDVDTASLWTHFELQGPRQEILTLDLASMATGGLAKLTPKFQIQQVWGGPEILHF